MPTTQPVQPATVPELRPEFVRVPDVRRTHGLCRSFVYDLIKDGKIKSVVLRENGSKVGVRLIDYASLTEFVQSAMSVDPEDPRQSLVPKKATKATKKKAA